MTELNTLDPTPEQITLSSGVPVQIEDLRTRQFFKLLRIITHGAMPIIGELKLFDVDNDTDANEFGGRLLSALLLSVPDAEDEAIEFVQAMCKPVGLIEGRKLNKQDTERNAALWAQVDVELENPELDDTVTIIEAVVRREAADIMALGKRLAAMLKLARKTGQLQPSPNPAPKTGTSSAGSADPSTSSPANTTGTTPASPTSPSNDSGSASPPSPNDAGTPPTANSSS